MPSTTMSLPRADGVSFVVPVRNGARWLPRVLPSLLAQDAGAPIEVVMVEDGSGDGSAEILARASAADARVKIVPPGFCGLHSSMRRVSARTAERSASSSNTQRPRSST